VAVAVVVGLVATAVLVAYWGREGPSEVEVKLNSAATHLTESAEAFSAEDWNGAEAKAVASKNDILAAYSAYREDPSVVKADDRSIMEAGMVLFRDLTFAMIDTSRLMRAIQEIGNNCDVTQVETLDYLPECELLADSIADTADQWDALALQIETLSRDQPRSKEVLDLDPATADDFRQAAQGFRDGATAFRDLIEQARAGSGYTPLEDRDIPREQTGHPDSPYFTTQVRNVFDGFDQDGSTTIDLLEARDFYTWVEDNIRYRYDDENVQNAIPGYPIGDGHDGPDYHQTPDETLTDSMGDCEDMNALEVAFYNYWGITAFEAYVNAQSQYSADHAIAIVYVGQDEAEARDTIGRIDSYQIQDGEWPGVPAGAYMLVDNAYSDTFGMVDGEGIQPGQFQIFEVHPLGEAFTRPIQ
jgi:hypothetical protein